MPTSRIPQLAILALALAPAIGPARAQQGQVSVYCSILEEQCREGAALFEKATGVKVVMIRKSTGETFAQIKAEASNPKADVWWGGPGEAHLQAAEEGLTDVYKSPALAGLRDWARAQAERSGYRAAGTYLGALGIGVNTSVLKQRGLKQPACWADLADPAYKGEIQMADPGSSGTAYTALATIVQLFGEEKGFDFLKAMHRNISQYTKSGIAPINALSIGETAIGIGFMHDMATQQLKGAPIAIVAPCEGTGYETGSVSIVRGARNLDNAHRFYDWTLGVEAQTINMRLKIYSIPSNPNVVVPPDAPDFSKIKLISYDTAKYGSAAERVRLLKKFNADVKALAR